MRLPPLPPGLAATAPTVALRLAVILRAVYALIAATFVRDPRRVALTIPLCNYISRTIRRFERVMTNAAAGTLRAHRARPARPSRPRLRTVPDSRAWLATTLGYEGRGLASQLNHLLAEPATVALLAATPQAGRVIRPLCHLLGIRPPVLYPPAPPRPVSSQRARPSRPPPAPVPSRPVPRGAPAALPAPDDAPYPRLRAPPCPRLAHRWPWNRYRYATDA